MSSILRIIGRYDRLTSLIVGAIGTFFMIYLKFNTMFLDIQNSKETLKILTDKAERVEIFMAKQVEIDSRQNEILSDLRESIKHFWRSDANH